MAALTLPTITGCLNEAAPPTSADAVATASMEPSQPVDAKAARLAQVVDVGSGVYVFPGNDSFARTLADFKAAHPDIRITTISQGPDEQRG